MVPRTYQIVLCVMLAGTLLAGCDFGTRETRAEKKAVKVCVRYMAQKYENAEALCRCQWKGIRGEVPREDMDRFLLRLTASHGFETKASRTVRRISRKCLRDVGPRPVD